MIKRFTLASLLIGILAAGAVAAAHFDPLPTPALAAPASANGVSTAAFGPPHAGQWPGPGAPPTPPTSADGTHIAFHAALGGQVSAVSGSTYTIAGPGASSVTVTATSSTTYVNADGSPADAAAVEAGVFITAEGTPSNDGRTLAAKRITIGRRQEGVFTTNRLGVDSTTLVGSPASEQGVSLLVSNE